MVAATRGLGFMVLNAAQYLQSDKLVMGIIAPMAAICHTEHVH